MIIIFISKPSVAFSAESSLAYKNIDNIIIVAPHWPKFTNHDGTGLYFDLIKLIYENENIQVSFNIVPWARAVKYIETNQADIIVGDTKDDTALQSNAPLDVETIVAISLKKKAEKWQGISTLENKVLGFIRGYFFKQKIPVNIKDYNFEEAKQGWGMLNKGRIDYYIENYVDALTYLKLNGVTPATYNFNSLWREILFPRFAKTAKGKYLADLYDKKYPEIYADGRLEALYNKYNIPYVDPYAPTLKAIEYIKN